MNDIKLSVESLERLINEIYAGAINDLNFIETMITHYHNQVTTSQYGAEMWATHLSEMLSNKNQARDRIIKVANLIKDRVKVQELLQRKAEGEDVDMWLNPEFGIKFLEKMEKEQSDG